MAAVGEGRLGFWSVHELGGEWADLVCQIRGPENDIAWVSEVDPNRGDRDDERNDEARRPPGWAGRLVREHHDGLRVARFEDVSFPEKRRQIGLTSLSCRPIEKRFEAATHLRGGSDSTFDARRETFANESCEWTRNFPATAAHSRVVARLDTREKRIGVILRRHLEGRPAAEHFVEDTPEGE